jgi:long-chain acyl-CoA synthetase
LTFIHGYGLTETSPVLACNRMADNDPMSVGHPVPGVEARMAENGELHIRGPIVMLGYWNNPTATAEVLEPDGWFHTGDIVEMRAGRIYIRGRVKDVIILSNGEKVPPGDAEQAIMRDTVFEQVMIVGEGRAHLGLLVVSKLEDEGELCRRANAQLKDFPGYAKIRHLARVREPWTVENGLITPTLKLKRNKIEERYAKEIEAMYKQTGICMPQ